jgi:Tol biopolymer transport system component
MSAVSGFTVGYKVSYLPDGQRVVYERYDPSIEDDAVWVTNVDGSHRTRIVGGGAADANVSPDGGSVTFKSGDIGALFIANLDGSGYHQISPELNVSFKHDWAPDGNRIAFSDNADALPGSQSTSRR